MAVEKLKEYAGVMVAAVMLVTTLAAAAQWAIHAQVRPEINRLDGRVDNYENLYGEIIGRLDRMENRLDRRFARIDDRFKQVDERFAQVDDRFKQVDDRFAQVDERFKQIDDRFRQVDGRFIQMDNRFVQLESRINQRFDDMAANMNLILTALSLGPRVQAVEPHEKPPAPKTE